MLSHGQLQAIVNKKKVDGSIASPQHMSNVRRAVKVKIQESTSDLRTVYEQVPEFRQFIRDSLRWFEESEGHKQVTAKKANQEKNPHGFPENVEDLPLFEPDESKAFAGFNVD